MLLALFRSDQFEGRMFLFQCVLALLIAWLAEGGVPKPPSELG